MDFTYEILDPDTINVRLNYGGEWFEFNLFYKENQWILHPFDATLLGNPDMCRLVVADLLANKPFQVMLAKERILISTLRTSIDVSGAGERGRGSDRRYDEDIEADTEDTVDQWIRSHTFEEIVSQELQSIEQRLELYNTLLQKMFYEDLGPGNEEFDKVQEITRIYKDASNRMKGLIDPDSFLRDLNKDKRRF
ncbi:hypothetical protein [Cohnella sp.]|uniref:hypothetical protein n=1 Tax=Cohnella sp. TaxID=1883426 RepID=UPI00356B2098